MDARLWLNDKAELVVRMRRAIRNSWEAKDRREAIQGSSKGLKALTETQVDLLRRRFKRAEAPAL